MPTATIGGRELFYDRHGAGEPLLMLMGMSGHHGHWGDRFIELLARDFEVVLFDHRGAGRSGRAEEPFTIADLADDADALLDAIGIARAHVFGLSLGGMVALELVLRHPGRVASLTLAATSRGGEGSIPMNPRSAQKLIEAYTSGDVERALRTGWELNVSGAFASDDTEYEQFVARSRAMPAPLAITMLQAQAGAAHDTSGRLESIETPTLVVHGDEDLISPSSNAELIAGEIPGARLEILEGVGHMLFLERPEQVSRLVREVAARSPLAAR